MKLGLTATLGCCSLLALSGCTRNTIVLVAPSAQAFAVAPPNCWLPEDRTKNYQTAHETKPVVATASSAAQSAFVPGCAAVTFQLTHDGRAKNVTVLREFPAGYGYSQAVTDAILHATFQPPASEQDLYYRAIGIGFTRGAPTITPVLPASPAKPPQRA